MVNSLLRFEMISSSTTAWSPCLACGLGHTRDLTAIQAVIQRPRAASLPAGEGIPYGCVPRPLGEVAPIGDGEGCNVPHRKQ